MTEHEARVLLEQAGYTVTPPPPPPVPAELTTWPTKRRDQAVTVTYQDPAAALQAFHEATAAGYSASLTHNPNITH